MGGGKARHSSKRVGRHSRQCIVCSVQSSCGKYIHAGIGPTSCTTQTHGVYPQEGSGSPPCGPRDQDGKSGTRKLGRPFPRHWHGSPHCSPQNTACLVKVPTWKVSNYKW